MVQQTAVQQAAVGKHRQADRFRPDLAQAPQRFGDRPHQIRGGADRFSKDHIRPMTRDEMIQPFFQIIEVTAEAAAGNLNRGNIRVLIKGGIHQIAALIVGDDPHGLALAHEVFSRGDDGRCLSAAQKPTDQMQPHTDLVPR